MASKLGEEIAAADLETWRIRLQQGGFVIARERFLVAFQGEKRVTACIHQFRIARFYRQGLVENFQGLPVLFFARQEDRVIGKGGDVVRRKSQQCLDTRPRVLVAVESNEHIGPVVERAKTRTAD